MVAAATEQAIGQVEVCKETDIAASIEITFESILEELGPGSEMPDGTPFPMVIEPRPGGLWYRDLGNDAGHLWGHVQVIKPPGLLELCGPMFMSYPAMNHLQYRLTPTDNGTRLKLTHRGVGLIPADHREGVGEGWDHALKRIREIAEGKAGNRR